MVLHNNFFINNKWTESKKGKKGAALNPATNELLGEISIADEEDVNCAAEIAYESFRDGRWYKKPLLQKSKILHKVGELIEKYSKELAEIETADVGKPIKESKSDISAGAETFHYFADILVDLGGEVIPSSDPEIFDYTIHEPVGVVTGITPWNFPFLIACRKIGTALAAGNSLIVKPSTLAPFSTLRLADILAEAGIPAGIVNIITGYGKQTGKILTKLPQIQGISFTGSTEVGKELIRCCGEDLKEIGLELGGKSPALILPDANLEEALNGVLFGIFLNQGECCCAATRILVHEDIYESFIPNLVEMTKKIRIGLPEKKDTEMGALISKGHTGKVLNYIEDGRQAGAKILCGGNKINEGELEKGNFVECTLFEDVSPDMRIFQEEIFGPVATITKCSTMKEMVSLANNSSYGLAASIWTTDLKSAHQIAMQLEVGTVWFNLHNFVLPMAPYGGYKESGIGRELGKEGVFSLTKTKNVMVSLMKNTFKWYQGG